MREGHLQDGGLGGDAKGKGVKSLTVDIHVSDGGDDSLLPPVNGFQQRHAVRGGRGRAAVWCVAAEGSRREEATSDGGEEQDRDGVG
ncbi:hypothetical protein GUJ93_ZPchr0013g34527 [Zizania palustris]|uniref:Uncharacterized protein n=1 Tax=Zizania palustris TaxID=103762 RepID=A0A8J5WZR6_ZIZPA|nr:hypothetical protein GUJ93_ZPchr0013g34527 [Zizania palustris]